MTNVLFLDLDGVVADFVFAACKRLGVSDPYLLESNHGTYNMLPMLGLSHSDFIKPFDYWFWRAMPQMPDAKNIMRFAKSLSNEIYFLSAPVETSGCRDGKVAWVKQYYPTRHLILSPAVAKQAVAHPGAYLLDDSDKNVDEFNARGGRGILVPRPWNKLHAQGWETSTMLRAMRTQVKCHEVAREVTHEGTH